MANDLTMDFGLSGNGGEYRGTGWSEPENFGIWMLGQQSLLVLTRPEASGDYRIEFDMGVLTGPGHPSQRFAVSVNGTTVGDFVLSDDSREHCMLPWSVIGREPGLTLVLSHPDAWRPSELSGGEGDQREMSFFLRSARLSLHAAASASTPVGTAAPRRAAPIPAAPAAATAAPAAAAAAPARPVATAPTPTAPTPTAPRPAAPTPVAVAPAAPKPMAPTPAPAAAKGTAPASAAPTPAAPKAAPTSTASVPAAPRPSTSAPSAATAAAPRPPVAQPPATSPAPATPPVPAAPPRPAVRVATPEPHPAAPAPETRVSWWKKLLG